MTTDEATRLHLYEQARSTWGPEAADTLMHALPWDPDQAATKTDLAELRSELRGEMAELRSDLRGDMAELRSELRGEMTELRSELRGEMAELRGEMRAMGGEIVQRLYFGMVATNATLVGLVFAAVKLG